VRHQPKLGSTRRPGGRPLTAVAYKPRKCTDSRILKARQSLAISTSDPGHGPPAEFAALPSRPHLLASERFHALFRSLFKVLFNFPSRYLFAIGLVVIFSLRWSLPPTSPCTRKQGDSLIAHIGDGCSRHGPCTLHGMEPHSGELTRASHTDRHHLHATVPVTVTSDRIRRWAFPLSLAVTMGIPVGFFSSA
jgi:hypothetical protein